MSYSIRRIIRALAAPKHRLSCSTRVWRQGVDELRRRTEGHHESGAFLLGREIDGRREIVRFEYYDDLDPHSLDTGIVVFDGVGYGKLWEICRRDSLTVVADVHVHPGIARQSPSDRHNPMISNVGHVALIVPDYASGSPAARDLGLYEFKGNYTWDDHSGRRADKYFYIGFWG